MDDDFYGCVLMVALIVTAVALGAGMSSCMDHAAAQTKLCKHVYATQAHTAAETLAVHRKLPCALPEDL